MDYCWSTYVMEIVSYAMPSSEFAQRISFFASEVTYPYSLSNSYGGQEGQFFVACGPRLVACSPQLNLVDIT